MHPGTHNVLSRCSLQAVQAAHASLATAGSKVQIDAATAHHAVALKLRPLFNPLRHLGLLLRRQAGRRSVAAWPVMQSIRPRRIVAVHPIAQALAVHRTRLGRILPRPSLQNQANRQHPARRFRILAAGRHCP